jgi:hypothetical protein
MPTKGRLETQEGGHSTEAIIEAAEFVYRGGFRPFSRMKLALELMNDKGRLYQNTEEKIFELLAPESWGREFYFRWLSESQPS